jgi:hypothetical protein
MWEHRGVRQCSEMTLELAVESTLRQGLVVTPARMWRKNLPERVNRD